MNTESNYQARPVYPPAETPIKQRSDSTPGCARFGKITRVALLLFLAAFPLQLASQTKLRVVTTNVNLAHLAERIGGEHVQVHSLMPPDVDLHYQDARPDYIIAVNRADLFIENGLELEVGWAPLIQKRSRNAAIQRGKPGYCDASIGIHVLEKPTEQISRKQGDVHAFGNPHYLLDPVNAAIAARNIGRSLIRLDPANADYYKKSYQELALSLRDLITTEIRKSANLRELPVAVYHKEFTYVANRLGFKEAASIEEIPGIPPSAAWLKKVSEQIKQSRIRIILVTPYHRRSYADTVARLSGAQVLVLPDSVNPAEGINTYEDLIRLIAKKLRDAADVNGAVATRQINRE
ncbi:MAG: zinc ABC transporter substrate-binding protein [Leptospiraceae bacterium]|nr:zinc ABC transporter substrate-binding protein [Leptospiraceae bacterium]